VQILRGVVLEVQPRDADALDPAFVLDFEVAAGGQRQFVHGNLVAFGQVGIKIVFSGEAGEFLDIQLQGQRRADAQLDRAFVQHRQCAGQAQTDGASVRIGRIAEARGAGAEGLGRGLQLHVDFETDDRLVARHDFGRDAREAFLCQPGHKSRLVYHSLRLVSLQPEPLPCFRPAS